MNIDEYYQKGRYAITGRSAKAELSRFYAKRVDVLTNALIGYSFRTILDAGCGDGEIGRLLKRQYRCTVYGIDISKKGVELATQKGVRAKVADMSVNIPFEDNTFDLVLSSATIEHVTNPDIFLKETHRVLKSDGIILLSTPNISFWLNRIIFLMGLYPLFLEASTEVKVGYGAYKKYFYGSQLVGHIHVFNLPALLELMRHHGFSIDRAQGGTVDFVTPSSRILTWLYRTVDKMMSHIPSLSSDLIVIAKKQNASFAS